MSKDREMNDSELEDVNGSNAVIQNLNSSAEQVDPNAPTPAANEPLGHTGMIETSRGPQVGGNE